MKEKMFPLHWGKSKMSTPSTFINHCLQAFMQYMKEREKAYKAYKKRSKSFLRFFFLMFIQFSETERDRA